MGLRSKSFDLLDFFSSLEPVENKSKHIHTTNHVLCVWNGYFFSRFSIVYRIGAKLGQNKNGLDFSCKNIVFGEWCFVLAFCVLDASIGPVWTNCDVYP